MISLLTTVFVIYLAIGVVFALPFSFVWVGRVDPSAATGTLGFRLLCIPGAALLWPLLLMKMRRA